jgi:hypothetical protein
MKTNEETPYTYSALALRVQLSSISANLNLINCQQNRREGDQTWPNLSRHQGTDQPGPGDS